MSDAALLLLIIGVSAVAVLMGAVLTVRTIGDAVGARRRRARAAVLPVLLEVLDGEDVVAPQRRRLRTVTADVAAELTHKLRGSDRERLAAWLTEQGMREAARQRMRSRWAPRRAQAIEAYLAATDGAEPEPVVALLRDRHARVRAAAVGALGSCGAAAAVPDLVAAMGSRRSRVSPSAVAMAIVHAAPTSADALAPAWRSSNPAVLTVAIEVIGCLGLLDGREQVESLLRSSDDHRVRDSAADALRRLGDPRSLPALEMARARVPADGQGAASLDRALATVRAGVG